MLQWEEVSENNVPEWLKKCMTCAHVYTTKDEEGVIKCRNRKGCNYKRFAGRRDKG